MIGILCGLKSEAKIADRLTNVIVGCSGAQREQAESMTRHMIEKGATRLISFGLCGAVSPDLVAGDLLLGTSVMAAKDQWEADGAWYKPLTDEMPHALFVSMWGSDKMATRAQDKAMIYRRTGCMAVDMESHVVARLAHEAGIPFNIIRAVSDTSDMDLPPAALVPLLKNGDIDPRAVWQSIKKTPAQWPELVRLGLGTWKAMRALKQAVRCIEG
ncbi:MAG TPA: hypothetical protein DCY07_01665 [Rhodospirillaceae bacterium]|nr:hypothetical protein [Rhodospirillaceae bacterium]